MVIQIAAVSLLNLGLIDFAQDPGVGWRLSSGQYISDTGKVPSIDPFLFSAKQLQFMVPNSLVLLMLCILATIINPYGIKLHLSILSLAQSDFFLNYHSEWLSLDFKSLEGRVAQIGLFMISIAPLLRINASADRSGKPGFGRGNCFLRKVES